MDISRDSYIALVLQKLEEYKVQDIDNKEQMIKRNGEFATMIQYQEEDKTYKLTEKEQRSMTSTPTGKALLLVQCVFYLHHFLQSYIPQNLGIASKVATLAMDSMFFFVDNLLHLQAVFRVSGKMPL